MIINREKTAISRKKHSKPYRYLLENNLIDKDMEILDYGCGKGYDFQQLLKSGYNISGYDKFNPDFNNEYVLLFGSYDVITCNYVLNTIEDINERKSLIERLKQLANVIYISVRADKKAVKENWIKYADGYITTANTFQKFYSLHELVNEIHYDGGWIFSVISSSSSEIMVKLEKLEGLL